MRFLLANTSGQGALALSEVQLGPVRRSKKGHADRQLERYILHELSQLEVQATASYDAFAFNKGKGEGLF